MIFHNYLNFSDAAKFADIARNLVQGNGFTSTFNFWNGNNALSISALTPYSIGLFFKIFGVNDFAVMATSFFYFLLSLVFVYLLTNSLFKDKLTAILTTIAVAFNPNLIEYSMSGGSESPFIFGLLASVYFITLKKNWANIVGFIFVILIYFTKPQAIIYIFGLILYYFLTNFPLKKGLLYSFATFIFGAISYLLFSQQGLVAVSQNVASDALRGATSDFNLITILKKVFYNLYNFYKAIPEIVNPYLFALFIIGLFKKFSVFNIYVAFTVLLTFIITALTIPFYRYLHPVVPFIYIVAVAALADIIKNKKYLVLLVALFAVGQTLGILFLDYRFESKRFNTNKPPIYVVMAYKLKEITNKEDMIVTNLDTWGSWYGDRNTVWFPLEPEMLLNSKSNIDAIYLTSYKMSDQNYYMSERWREIFNNPENQQILPNYKLLGEYEFNGNENFETEKGRAILLVRDK